MKMGVGKKFDEKWVQVGHPSEKVKDFSYDQMLNGVLRFTTHIDTLRFELMVTTWIQKMEKCVTINMLLPLTSFQDIYAQKQCEAFSLGVIGVFSSVLGIKMKFIHYTVK